MNKIENIEIYYMKQSSKMFAMGLVVVSIIIFFIALTQVGGAPAGLCLVFIVLSLFMVNSSTKPQLMLHNDYIETPNFKLLYSDIIEIKKNRNYYFLKSKDGSTNVFFFGYLEKEPKLRLIELLDDLKQQKEQEQ